MSSFRLSDFHLPKGPNLFIAAKGAVVCFAIALVAFVISWLVGGPGYKVLLGGNVTLAVLIVGLVVSEIFALSEKPKD